MGLNYRYDTRTIDVTYEKTDYKTDYDTNRATWREVEGTTVTTTVKVGPSGGYTTLTGTLWTTYAKFPDGTRAQRGPKYISNYRMATNPESEYYGLGYDSDGSIATQEAITWSNTYGAEHKRLNEQGAYQNQQNTALNFENTKLNNSYDVITRAADNSSGGDYLQKRGSIETQLDGYVSSSLVDSLKKEFRNFYTHNKVPLWDVSSGVQPPYGQFDTDYYGDTYSDVAESWTNAVNNDNVDITHRYAYSPDSYYFWHYTNNGRYEGRRGNAVEATSQADNYVEAKPTDQEIQDVRDRQLGVDIDTTTERLLNIPYIASEWEKAKQGDEYWKNLAKDKYLDINNPDDFSALFRLSQRDEDKQISLEYNLNLNYGITELEDVINQVTGEQAIVDTKKFGALAQDVLKEAVGKIKEAKAKETELDFLSNFGGLGEILNINETLSNSLLGDSGVGGVLAITGDKESFEQSFESGLSDITGVDTNIVSYNWQKWFDETLTQRYQDNLNLGLTQEEAEQQIAIEKEFAQNFVVDYLTPRFNESRSMDEFVEYIDVRQNEQNPFQTQSMLDAVAQLAQLRADEYLETLENAQDKRFDPNFYFNPVGNTAREAEYAAQKADVEAAWAAAKANPNADINPALPNLGTWAQQAYRFGLNIDDKASFARMHFQVVGQGKGYDPAEDVLTAGKVKDLIYEKILPQLNDQALESGNVFGEFITPAEFADDILEGLDPNEPDAWEEALESLGIDNFEGTIEELKQYIIEVLQTGSAAEIRQQLKYLNEKRERPTQKNLGITYIEREEDYNPGKQEAETELYQKFRDAGFQGTEEEFYRDFMPDANIDDQRFLTSAASGQGVVFEYGDYSDPFSAFASLQQLTVDEEEQAKEKEEEEKKTADGLFDLSLNLDDDDDDYKTDSGRSFLNQFTSSFTFNK